uniref:O-glucosyltransferase rumi homolog n=1 Tax=Rhizophora mucronata TaxID=61149 RepID=A0A2P2P4F1_RHIMU
MGAGACRGFSLGTRGLCSRLRLVCEVSAHQLR